MEQLPTKIKRFLGISCTLFTIFFIGFPHAQSVLGETLDSLQLVPIAGMEAPTGVHSSVVTGETDPNQILHVAVGLPYANQAAMQLFVDSVSNPKSPNYRHFITPEEVGARFGLPETDVQQVKDYLLSNGFTVTTVAKNRLSILADTTVSNAETAFHTQINNYVIVGPDPSGDSTRFTFNSSPKIPSDIAAHVTAVQGLENFNRPTPRELNVNQERVLQNLAPLYNGGDTGLGRTICIANYAEQYGLNDLSLFYAQYNLPIPAGGVGSNLSFTNGNTNIGSGGSVESNVDLQMVLGMAPLANVVMHNEQFDFGMLTQIANDNNCDIVTSSYGNSTDNSYANTLHALHLSLTAQGITYMVATGDTGTTIQPWVYPDYEPEVLDVGGTSPNFDASGNRISETGWSGSGGGWITHGSFNETIDVNTLPSWQVGNGVPTNINYRLIPDVANPATGNGGIDIFYSGTLHNNYIGTSFSAPMFAGQLAVAEQEIIAQGGLTPDGAGKQRFGRIQDLFYSQDGRSDVWNDVTSGCNGTLPDSTTSCATAGWDMVTGWGSINWVGFVNSQVTNTDDFTLDTTQSSQTVAQGSGTSFTVNVTAVNSFVGNTDLTIDGLPTGVGALFTPSTVSGGTGSSTLDLTTTGSTPVGDHVLSITGTSGTLIHTVNVTLTVTAGPNFSIAAAPSSQSVNRGSVASYTVTTTASGGFTNDTNLTLSGLPANTTALFTPSTIVGGGGTSALDVTTTGSTPLGTSTLTITGTSGGTIHTTTVDLTVTTPDFALSESPSTRTIVQGSATTFTTTITPSNGFNADTDLTISGVPANATAVFSPSTVTGGTGSSTLTITTTSSTPTGTSTLTITGTSGNLVHTTTVDLTVNPPADFSLSASPTARSVVQGSSTTFTSTLTALYGFSSATNFSVSGAPSGTTVSFSPAQLTGAGNSTLTIATASSTTSGSYALTITGTSGSLVHTTTVTITVTAAPVATPTPSPTPKPNVSSTTTPTSTPKPATSGTATPTPTATPTSVPSATPNPTDLLNTYPEYTNGGGKTIDLRTTQTVYFLVNGEQHKAEVKKIDGKSVTLTISSTPFDALFFIGQTGEYDVNDDGIKDIQIALNSIKDNTADLTFKQVDSTTSVPTIQPTSVPSQTPSTNRYLWLYGLGGLLAIGILSAFFALRRR